MTVLRFSFCLIKFLLSVFIFIFVSLDLTVFLLCGFLLVLVLQSSLYMYTMGYARTNVVGSRTSFVIASVCSTCLINREVAVCTKLHVCTSKNTGFLVTEFIYNKTGLFKIISLYLSAVVYFGYTKGG